MKYILLFILATSLEAQDTVRIKHANYTTVFSKSKKYYSPVARFEPNKNGRDMALKLMEMMSEE